MNEPRKRCFFSSQKSENLIYYQKGKAYFSFLKSIAETVINSIKKETSNRGEVTAIILCKGAYYEKTYQTSLCNHRACHQFH